MNLSDIRIDGEAVEAGAWIGDIPDMPGVELFVRGIDCRAARDMRARQYASRLRSLRDQCMPDAMIEHSMSRPREGERSRVLFEAVLVDWRGFTEEGEPVHYSRDLAEKMIMGPDYPAFRMAVVWAADRVGRSAAVLERM